uniref:Cyclic nucleotide-binding domain-containing protein n=1 Tax=Haemonchus contortus TaxID=6289 RepID=A0A7I4YMI1_HAECO
MPATPARDTVYEDKSNTAPTNEAPTVSNSRIVVPTGSSPSGAAQNESIALHAINQEKPLTRQSTRIDVNQTEKVDAGPNLEMNLSKKNFVDVVRTAMIVRNWMMSANEERDRTVDHNTSLVFEPPVQAENVPILTENEDVFEVETTGFEIFKAKAAEWSRKLIYFYVSPSGYFYYYWTCFVSIGLLYNMMAMVIFIFDDVFIGYFFHWLYLNIFFDCVFLLDILIQSRTTYTFDGSEVKNVKMTLRNYYKSFRIYLDIASLIPTDLVLIFNRSISLVRAVRLFKIYRLNDFIEKAQKRTAFPHAFKIALLISACYILFHWNACVYFLFSLAEGLSEDDTNAFGFSYYKVFDPRIPTCSVFNDQNCQFPENFTLLDIDDHRPRYMQEMYEFWAGKFVKWEMGNFSREYSMSIYWSALTITTCGQQPYPSTSSQNMLEVIDTLIGVLVFATIIGGVGSVVTHMNEEVYEFRQKMDGIKFYMKYRMVTPAIQERVISCFTYMHSQHQLNDEKELLDVLPPRLQGQIAVNLHMDTLKKVELFKQCSAGFLYEVVLRIKQQIYSPNDYLFRAGERAKEMFIVKRGTLRVIDEENAAATMTLTDGSTFGEMSVILIDGNQLGSHRAVSLRSEGYSDIYILNQDDVSTILQEYPTDRQQLLDNAREMLRSRNLLSDGEVESGDQPASMLSLEEQLSRMKAQIGDLDGQLNNMYASFNEMSTEMKRRVTAVERLFARHRRQIKLDCLRGKIRF